MMIIIAPIRLVTNAELPTTSAAVDDNTNDASSDSAAAEVSAAPDLSDLSGEIS